MESPAQQWFPCAKCDRVVTGQVLGTGTANTEETSRTHCCHNCEKGLDHDSFWCAGTPSRFFREVDLPQADATQPPERARYLLHEPDSGARAGPAPALLWLHGALTFLYPETLQVDLSSFLDKNPKAREFYVIAPLAVRGECLAVESDWRKKPDRFENEVWYVDRFDEERTWACFVAACRQLGPACVDFERLCITGLSMGAQATWEVAIHYGSYLAVAAPMAATCAWRGDAWDQQDQIFDQLKGLPLRAYSVVDDSNGYSWRDLQWLAQRRGEEWDPVLEKVQVSGASDGQDAVEAHVYSWGKSLQLVLIHGHRDGHNCWDMVYQQERTFGLFEWMAASRNPRGLELQ